MIARACLVWLALLLLAILNGAFRLGLLIPHIGERAGLITSTLLLCALILGATWALLPWIRARTARDAWIVGALWLGLTLAFEFLAGHYFFGESWEGLLAAYDLARGRIWVLIPISTLLAPGLARALRRRPA